MFSHLKLVPNKENKYGVNYLEITNLKEGQYRLILKKEGVTIDIAVHKGNYWNDSDNFILK